MNNKTISKGENAPIDIVHLVKSAERIIGAWGAGSVTDFARFERHSQILWHVAHELIELIWAREEEEILEGVKGFCGVPVSGQALACALAQEAGAMGENFALEYIFPQGNYEDYYFSRHKPVKGEKWLIVDDILYELSRVREIISLLEGYRSSVAAIVCFCNYGNGTSFSHKNGIEIPIISLVSYVNGVLTVTSDKVMRSV